MKTKDDKNRFLETLEKMPFISHASKQAGIDKATIYRWRKKDKKFNAKVEDALAISRSALCDVAESQVIKKINQGDFRASKFFLENNDKRYIRPRAITIINNSGKDDVLTEEQKKKLDKILNAKH